MFSGGQSGGAEPLPQYLFFRRKRRIRIRDPEGWRGRAPPIHRLAQDALGEVVGRADGETTQGIVCIAHRSADACAFAQFLRQSRFRASWFVQRPLASACYLCHVYCVRFIVSFGWLVNSPRVSLLV